MVPNNKMDFLKHYLLIFALCILYVESTYPIMLVCNKNSKKTTTEITRNIDSLVTKLVQVTSQSGYNATSVGTGKTQVFGLAQCRGDVPAEDCSSCIQNASKEIRNLCPNRVEAGIWYDYCWLRYNIENFIGIVDMEHEHYNYNIGYVTDPKTFEKRLGALVHRINMLASAPGSKGVGKGETKLSDVLTLYALSQCSEDLSQLSCRQCLSIADGNFQTRCKDVTGCRIMRSSCYVRYELSPFFFPLDNKLAKESSSMTNYPWGVTKP